MIKTTSFRLGTSLAVLASLAAGAAQAQTAETPVNTGGIMDEIVVTAQRRSQNLQDVGISVTAFSDEQLKAAGVVNSIDVARLTPGVAVSGSIGGQNSQFTIRGVTQNDFNDGIEAPVAVYVDETYIPNLQGQNFGAFDIERVEVLKGPQGTLFGRNATGGLVHFVPRKPTEELDGFIDATYGRFNQTRLEAALGGGLGGGLSARASIYYNGHDPIFKNVYPAGMAPGSVLGLGAPITPCCEDIWTDDTLSARIQVMYAPEGSGLNIRLTGAYSRQRLSSEPNTSIPTVAVVDAQGRVIDTIIASPTETRTAIGPNGQNLPGAFNGPQSRVPGADFFGFRGANAKALEVSKDFAFKDLNTTDSYNTALHINYDFGDINLTSITDYKRLKKDFAIDVDASPANVVSFGANNNTRSISQEIRLNGRSDTLNWTVGGYYLDIDSDTANGFMALPRSFFAGIFGAVPTGIDLSNEFTLRTKSLSGFGQIEYKFTDKLTFIAGARVISERQAYDFMSNAYANSRDQRLDTSGPALFPLQPSFTNNRTTTLFAGKAQLEYRPNDDLLIYVGVNRGVKGGSYNALLPDGSPPLAPDDIPYRPEKLTSYEGGFKATIADRVLFNAAAYYYDYKDFQAFTFSNVSGFVQNRDARTYGIEADVSAELFEGFQAAIAVSAFDAKVKNVQVAPGVFRDVKPTFAPETQLSGRLNYRIPTPVAGGTVMLAADGSYQSSFFHNIRNFQADRLPGYWLLNGNIGWRQDNGGLGVSVGVQNIFDKRYANIGFNLATLCGCSEESYGRPRWWNVSVRYEF
jgi:iron complex outermembrane receptor protein